MVKRQKKTAAVAPPPAAEPAPAPAVEWGKPANFRAPDVPVEAAPEDKPEHYRVVLKRTVKLSARQVLPAGQPITISADVFEKIKDEVREYEAV